MVCRIINMIVPYRVYSVFAVSSVYCFLVNFKEFRHFFNSFYKSDFNMIPRNSAKIMNMHIN